MRPALLIPKPDNNDTNKQKKSLQTNISYEHWCKNPQRDTQKSNSEYMKRIIQYDQVRLISGLQG